ncbi:hypothetical protein HK105_208001 [Polyrhizophydium stewartii]|uniref:G-protein coupled receptors family 3 profile domain-containing protein n=1 Tax=Polyrhizophydium stewartii TaxID=2732419 RepID=A0ABR4MZ16_9FUNG
MALGFSAARRSSRSSDRLRRNSHPKNLSDTPRTRRPSHKTPKPSFHVSAFSVWNSSVSPSAPNVIKIGINIPSLAGSPYYSEVIFGFQLWASYLANTTNLLPGAILKLIELPTDMVPATSVSLVYNAIRNLGAVAIIGTQASSFTKSTSIISATSNIPQCDGAATSPDLSDKTVYSTFFRTIPSDRLQGRAIFNLVQSRGWRRVAVLYESLAYGTGLMQVFTDLVATSNIRIASQQVFPYGGYTNVSDWDPYLLDIQKKRLFIIVLLGSRNQALVERIGQLGMNTSDYVWITSESFYRSSPIGYHAGIITVFPTEGYGPQNEAFYQIWRSNIALNPVAQANNPLYPTKASFLRFITLRARSQSGSSDTTLQYVTSQISCLDVLLRGFDRYLTQSGGTRTVAQLAAGTLTSGFPSVVSMFGGFGDIFTPVGKIALNSNGDPVLAYDIYNVQNYGGLYKKVGVWDAVSGNFSFSSDIIYASGTGETPLDDISPLTHLKIVAASSPAGIAAIVVNMVLVALLVGLLVYFGLRRDDRRLKATSVESHMFVIAGLTLACFDVFTMVGTPTRSSCIADIWILGLAFPLVLGAVAIKLARIWVIINGLSALRMLLQRGGLLIATAALVAIEAAILLAWTLRDAPQPAIIGVSFDSFQHICTSANDSVQRGFTVALIVWNGVLLLACAVLAAATRNVQSEFNEAKYIGAAVYNQIIILAVAVAILFGFSRSIGITILFFVKQGVIVFTVAATAASLFGHTVIPKLGNQSRRSTNDGKMSDILESALANGHVISVNPNQHSTGPQSHDMGSHVSSFMAPSPVSPTPLIPQGSQVQATAVGALPAGERFVRFSGKYKESGGVVNMWTACEFTYYVAEHMLVFRLEQLSWNGKETKVVRDQGLSKPTVLFVKEVKGLQVGQDMKEPMLMLRTKEDDIATIKLADHDKVTKLVDMIRQGIAEGAAPAKTAKPEAKKKGKRETWQQRRMSHQAGAAGAGAAPAGIAAGPSQNIAAVQEETEPPQSTGR